MRQVSLQRLVLEELRAWDLKSRVRDVVTVVVRIKAGPSRGLQGLGLLQGVWLEVDRGYLLQGSYGFALLASYNGLHNLNNVIVPKGPSTQIVRLQGPKTIQSMDFGT